MLKVVYLLSQHLDQGSVQNNVVLVESKLSPWISGSLDQVYPKTYSI